MNLLTIWQHKFAVLVAVLALLIVLAIGALAAGGCTQIDDYGNCIAWNSSAPPAPDASDILSGIGS